MLVVGTGALGSMVAAYVGRAGETVPVLASGARASYLRLCGVAGCTGPWTVVPDPRTVQEVDTLAVAVKAYETASALTGLRHLRAQRVFFVLNGLLKHEQRASAFGAQEPIDAAYLCAGGVRASGAVRSTLERERSLGPRPGQEVTPTQSLGHTLRHAGLQAGYSARMHTLAWSRFVGWVGFPTWRS